MENHYELFSLPISYDIDEKQLEQQYFQLQRQWHPDRFAAKEQGEKEQALRMTMQINDAYKTLRNPRRRAEYLLRLKEIFVNSERDNLKPSPRTLMEIMESQEQLQACETIQQISKLSAMIRDKEAECLLHLHDAFEEQDYQTAAQLTIRLKYLTKLVEEIRTRTLSLHHEPA